MTLKTFTLRHSAAAVNRQIRRTLEEPKGSRKTCEKLRRNVRKAGYSPRALAATASTRGTRKGLVR
jgi:hypothetical protein